MSIDILKHPDRHSKKKGITNGSAGQAFIKAAGSACDVFRSSKGQVLNMNDKTSPQPTSEMMLDGIATVTV